MFSNGFRVTVSLRVRYHLRFVVTFRVINFI